MFLKIMHEKNKSLAKMVKHKNKGFFHKEMVFFATFVQQQNDNFFVRDPKRRLIQENQEKAMSRNVKKTVKHGTDKEQGPRNEEKHETKHRRKEGSQIKDPISSSKKIDHRKF